MPDVVWQCYVEQSKPNTLWSAVFAIDLEKVIQLLRDGASIYEIDSNGLTLFDHLWPIGRGVGDRNPLQYEYPGPSKTPEALDRFHKILFLLGAKVFSTDSDSNRCQRLLAALQSEPLETGPLFVLESLGKLAAGYFISYMPSKALKGRLLGAVMSGNTREAESLIKKGANVNGVYELGNTLLHYAFIREDNVMIALLAYYGADFDAKDVVGRTASQASCVREEYIKYIKRVEEDRYSHRQSSKP